MLSTHLLSTISGPAWRLGVVQNALPLSLIAGGILYVVWTSFFSIFVIAAFHGLVMYWSYRDPYFMKVWTARFSIKRSRRQHPSGGNCYVA